MGHKRIHGGAVVSNDELAGGSTPITSTITLVGIKNNMETTWKSSSN